MGKKVPFMVILLIIFIAGNILSFSSLHPSKLTADRGLPFDYGFWPESVKAGFNWTKDRSGILLEMNDKGEYGPIKIFCGAPIDKIPGRTQHIKIFRNGKLLETRKFNANEEYVFRIRGNPGEKIFLKMEVSPVFNLKKMGLGLESRDLGVQFFPESRGL